MDRVTHVLNLRLYIYFSRIRAVLISNYRLLKDLGVGGGGFQYFWWDNSEYLVIHQQLIIVIWKFWYIFKHKQKFSDFLKLIILITLVQASQISTTFVYFLDWVRYWLYVDDVAVWFYVVIFDILCVLLTFWSLLFKYTLLLLLAYSNKIYLQIWIASQGPNPSPLNWTVLSKDYLWIIIIIRYHTIQTTVCLLVWWFTVVEMSRADEEDSRKNLAFLMEKVEGCSVSCLFLHQYTLALDIRYNIYYSLRV